MRTKGVNSFLFNPRSPETCCFVAFNSYPFPLQHFRGFLYPYRAFFCTPPAKKTTRCLKNSTPPAPKPKLSFVKTKRGFVYIFQTKV